MTIPIIGPLTRLRSPSDQIQPPRRRPGSIAVQTRAPDDQCVAGHLELILAADLLDRRFNGRVLEFNHLSALPTDQMLVLRIAVVVLEVSLVPNLQLAEHAGVDEFGESAVDGCPAD